MNVAITATINQDVSNKELEKELKRFLIPKIRSASYRWKYRSDAIKKARVDRGLYKCAQCGDSNLKKGDYLLDHVEPVVSLDGWDGNWDTYIKRMFVGTEGFQVLCHPCHSIKTDLEVQIRKIRREEKKKPNEND